MSKKDWDRGEKQKNWERKERNPEEPQIPQRQEKRIIELHMTTQEFDRRWDEIRHRIDVKKELLIIHVEGVKYVSSNVYTLTLEE